VIPNCQTGFLLIRKITRRISEIPASISNSSQESSALYALASNCTQDINLLAHRVSLSNLVDAVQALGKGKAGIIFLIEMEQAHDK
jgi:hypothetical protein